MKKIISYIVCFIFIFNIFCFSVSASTLDDDVFRKNSNGQYYLVDTSNLPSGMHFFFKYADGRAWYCTNSEMFTRVTNNFGLTVKPSEIPSLVTSWIGYLSNGSFKNGREVVNGSTVVGYAVNDISGCKLTSHGGTGGSFGVPSELVNDTYDFCEDEVNSISPDFINFPTCTDNQFLSFTNRYSDVYNVQMNIINTYDNIGRACFYYNNSEYLAYIASTVNSTEFNFGTPIEDLVFVPRDSLNFDRLVTFFNLSTSNNVISFTDFFNLSTADLHDDLFQCNAYNKTDFSSSSFSFTRAYYNANGVTINQTVNDGTYCTLALIDSSNKCLFMSNLGYVTVYKSIDVPSQIKNNIYSPTFIHSNTYTNFDSTSNSNEFTCTVTEISNSTSNNETIYNNSKTEINQNTSNNNYQYNVDNSSTIVNNIINNYYGSSDNPDNPDNPDDGNWWDSIISAIGGFFEGLGRIVAEIISGIIGIFTDVLNMIADLQVDITALQDFFQQIFGFFPPEIVSLISVSIGLMILICIIKSLK